MHYGRTAKYYNGLSRLFFRDALLRAHVLACQHFPPGSSLLVLGGGTGHYLPYLKNYRITYVDIAPEMLEKARTFAGDNSEFILADARTIALPAQCRGVILPFLLDNWTDHDVQQRLGSLPKSCPIVVADFTEQPRGFFKFFQKTMYLFFYWVAGVKARQMPAIEKHMREASRQKVTETSLYYSFIEIKVYL